MQLGENECSTKALTKSFGWDDYQTFVQHDIQEFLRVLMDNLETKMKGTSLDGRIANLFRGKSRLYIRCLEVDYKSERDEDFYDLSMVVRGCPDLVRSFELSVEKEHLVGDNKYSVEGIGKSDAEMGIEFLEFPSILQLHLRRFEFDFHWDRMMMINDRFEFPETIDLSPFLAKEADRSRSAKFDLYGVLVHTGSAQGGHYFAFLRPSMAPEWFQFNDTRVSRATSQQAIQDNYGSAAQATSGYMLIYVRQDDAPMIFAPVDDSTIPAHLREFVEHGQDIVSD
jgi:ubiquitin carboxyl-terminal hydrolase 7